MHRVGLEGGEGKGVPDRRNSNSEGSEEEDGEKKCIRNAKKQPSKTIGLELGRHGCRESQAGEVAEQEGL